MNIFNRILFRDLSLINSIRLYSSNLKICSRYISEIYSSKLKRWLLKISSKSEKSLSRFQKDFEEIALGVLYLERGTVLKDEWIIRRRVLRRRVLRRRVLRRWILIRVDY